MHHTKANRSRLSEMVFGPNGRRRRRRPMIEGQIARCPICNQGMVALMGPQGPRFYCGCRPGRSPNSQKPSDREEQPEKETH